MPTRTIKQQILSTNVSRDVGYIIRDEHGTPCSKIVTLLEASIQRKKLENIATKNGFTLKYDIFRKTILEIEDKI